MSSHLVEINEAIREDSNASSQEDNIMLKTEESNQNLLEPYPLDIGELRNEAKDYIQKQSNPSQGSA